MIRTTAVPRPLRVGVAAASVVGVVALAGCAAGAADADSESTAPSTASTPAASTPAATATGTSGEAGAATTSTYADGTYTAEGSYQTPESIETISVTVTLEDDIITSVEVTGDPQKSESRQYQGEFIGGIKDVVVGKDIDEISVSRVAGSSLTSNGFNAAIEEIKTEAAA